MLDLSYTAPKPKLISGAKHDWELVIGMEVHAQVASNAKLFSAASTAFGKRAQRKCLFRGRRDARDAACDQRVLR